MRASSMAARAIFSVRSLSEMARYRPRLRSWLLQTSISRFSHRKVAFEPLACETCNLVKRSGLFKKMRCPWNDHELLFTAHLRERFPVWLDYSEVISAPN